MVLNYLHNYIRTHKLYRLFNTKETIYTDYSILRELQGQVV